MSRVECLVESRDNWSVKFMEYTRLVGKKSFVCFFEGEDEKYFTVRIKGIFQDISWAGISCGGKSNVLILRDRIKNNTIYKDEICMFFVDADFDDNTEISNYQDVYITPCYSIENLYLSQDTFIRILSSEFGINEANDCFNKVLSSYEQIKTRYLKAIAPFNFLIRELRLMEKQEMLSGRLNINNIKINKLIDININDITKIYDEKKPKTIFPELSTDIEIDINNSKEYFQNLSHILWFRGKQHIDFLRVFLDLLKRDRCNKENRIIFNEQGKVKLNLSKENCISELSQYADTPKCLIEFLERQKTYI